MDWIIESAEGDILIADLEKGQAEEKARSMAETRNEPVSVQNVKTGHEIVYLPDGQTEQHS